jgi:hypothetical protein
MFTADIACQLTSLSERLLRRIVERFRGGLVFKAHGRLYHSTMVFRVGNNAKKKPDFKAQVRISQKCMIHTPHGRQYRRDIGGSQG